MDQTGRFGQWELLLFFSLVAVYPVLAQGFAPGGVRESSIKEIDVDDENTEDIDDKKEVLKERKHLHKKKKETKKVNHGDLRPGQDSDEDIILEPDEEETVD